MGMMHYVCFSQCKFFVTFCTEVIEGSLADKYGFCKQVYIIEIPSQLSWQQFWSVLKYDLGWLRQLCVCVFVVMLLGYNVESPAKLNEIFVVFLEISNLQHTSLA